jgi:hypothetical protein
MCELKGAHDGGATPPYGDRGIAFVSQPGNERRVVRLRLLDAGFASPTMPFANLKIFGRGAIPPHKDTLRQTRPLPEQRKTNEIPMRLATRKTPEVWTHMAPFKNKIDLQSRG